MKTKQITVMGLAALCAMAFAGEASARGGNGGGSGMKVQTQTRTQTQTATGTATTRPVGSQRRDGTFLTTGTTANGSTTRPSNGKGLQDGSGLAVPATTVPVTTV
ncbi:MAG: hypothetical protein J0665_06010, partial [Deltaproteobacteria bacterium]|nr:hypothetical protein [Deltaproteobacteria bacterium]